MSDFRRHAGKGYKIVADTTPTVFPFFEINVLATAVVTSITEPGEGINPDRIGYDGDEAGLTGRTLPVGRHPIRGSAITLASGVVQLLKE